jgi:asparagine synthetase A
LRAYDLTNNRNLNGVNFTVEFNGQIIANELTAGDWTKLAGMPDRETVTLTSILNGYHPNIQTILVDINDRYILIGMSPNVISFMHIYLLNYFSQLA